MRSCHAACKSEHPMPVHLSALELIVYSAVQVLQSSRPRSRSRSHSPAQHGFPPWSCTMALLRGRSHTLAHLRRGHASTTAGAAAAAFATPTQSALPGRIRRSPLSSCPIPRTCTLSHIRANTHISARNSNPASLSAPQHQHERQPGNITHASVTARRRGTCTGTGNKSPFNAEGKAATKEA